MNLWVKPVGQLASVAVALFFFSCQDNISQLGFKNPNSQLNMSYEEITLESSVYLVDSINTGNYTNATNRILVGGYEDPAFGKVKTTAFSHFFPPSAKLDSFPRLDSVAIQLRFDYYSYGSAGATTQTFSVHELAEEMEFEKTYFSKTPILYNLAALGTKSFRVDAATFKTEFDKDNTQKDTTVLNIRLADEFGQRIINRMKETNGVDSTFSEFIKGLAIVPDAANDKVVGFDNNNLITSGSTFSRVIVYFHTVNAKDALKEDSLRITMPLSGISFTKIDADRSTSADLSALSGNNFYQAIQPPVYRYAQTGTGVSLKLDFQKFFDFAEQHPNILINSCELAINDIEGAEQYRPIGGFMFRVLKDDNQYRRTQYEPVKDVNGNIVQYVVSQSDALELNAYSSKLTQSLSDVGGYFSVVGDAGSTAVLQRDGNNYSAYMSLFAQQLYAKKDAAIRYRYYGLVPTDPPNGKAVNRLMFNKDNLKLKIYYSIPTQID
jgi:hypothetical protein